MYLTLAGIGLFIVFVILTNEKYYGIQHGNPKIKELKREESNER